ncbi:synaptotagmin-like protein 4 isoform X2 [Gadus chalcogrammus]|uniref:synaptotagmin-like protein 4 isoform X2 n=1 Tax=Gadus chalcogrammus TaxID=1042646 RepID=UPI0024C4E330|nr:synaptotagmin-like protein 4 isoform X2 [Gadus chalcogrammus]
MPEVEEMINLAYLTDAERELIVEVLHRDAELRKNEEQRIRKLKSDLQDTKRKGAKRGSGRYSLRSCGRCQQAFSRLSLGSSQCRACKHNVCPKCRSPRADGSCLCTVCAKEADLKKCTGDWFYDHRVNRFSTKQGHELVRSSLKRPAALKKRQTAGEILLRSASEEAPLKALPLVPVPHPRQKPPQPPAADREDPVCAPRIGPPHASKPQSSDADNVDGSSLSSRKTLALSASTTPEPLRRGKVQSSPAGSDVSSGNVSSKADSLSSHGSSSDAAARESACGSLDKAPEEQHVGRSPDTSEGEGMFKKSIRRRNTPVHASALDLREEAEEGVRPAMGHRSRSVPGLDIQDEEDEDIDSLVNLHKKTVSTSRRSSSVTMGSTMSIYSDTGDYDSVDVSGEIVYTVSYDEHTQSLIVFIKECHDLAYGDAARRHCNPYVKCYLLPEKSRQSKRKTAIKRNTTNPVYNETLKYSVGRQQLTNQTLAIAVWHNGRLSRNAFLGEVMVTLDVRDLDSPQEECVVLMAKTASPELASAFAQYKGELVICLKYVTPKKPAKAERLSVKKAHAVEGGELHVLIKEAKSLVAMKGGATSDTFVKGHLLPANVKSTKRKTPVVKKNHNPHYDHTFVYKELSLGQLRDMCLELTVWDRESVASNEFMGGVRLSTGIGNLTVGKDGVEMDSQGEEVSVWEKMMQFPDSWAEGTLRLRSTMGKTPKKGLQTLFSH